MAGPSFFKKTMDCNICCIRGWFLLHIYSVFQTWQLFLDVRTLISQNSPASIQELKSIHLLPNFKIWLIHINLYIMPGTWCHLLTIAHPLEQSYRLHYLCPIYGYLFPHNPNFSFFSLVQSRVVKLLWARCVTHWPRSPLVQQKGKKLR